MSAHVFKNADRCDVCGMTGPAATAHPERECKPTVYVSEQDATCSRCGSVEQTRLTDQSGHEVGWTCTPCWEKAQERMAVQRLGRTQQAASQIGPAVAPDLRTAEAYQAGWDREASPLVRKQAQRKREAKRRLGR